MSAINKKRICITLLCLAIFNGLVLSICIKEGIDRNNPMLRFNEKEAVTFLSALMLGATSLACLILYLLKRKSHTYFKKGLFWLITSIGFFYLCLDEYFMAHEGMDEFVGYLLTGKDISHLNLDATLIAFFGLVAICVCIYFFKSIAEHRVLLVFLYLGGFFLALTVTFHFLERINIFLEVAEESLKLIGVSMFFAGFLNALLSFLDDVSIKPTVLKNEYNTK
ncbi:MAG: hypothetical protein P9L96_01420 [Candidatus Gygaella obscura]|nr:hypothetical protein [Candidatus Gygaella obscura]